MDTFISALYMFCGMALPLWYGQQIAACCRDRTGLSAYSLNKALVQAVLRLAMLPFVVHVGGLVLVAAVLDMAGRCIELAAATVALRRQGWTWRRIRQRALALGCSGAIERAASAATRTAASARFTT